MWSSIAAAAVVIFVIAYIFGYRQPAIEKGNEAIGAADTELVLGNDSVALDLYRQVADRYGFAAGNRAALQSAILLYQKGEYQDALNYVNDFKAKDDLTRACAEGLKGDCYANLDELQKAESAFNKAFRASKGNPSIAPYFLMKRAHVQEALENWKGAAATYGQIEKEFPIFAAQTGAEANRLRCEAL